MEGKPVTSPVDHQPSWNIPYPTVPNRTLPCPTVPYCTLPHLSLGPTQTPPKQRTGVTKKKRGAEGEEGQENCCTTSALYPQHQTLYLGADGVEGAEAEERVALPNDPCQPRVIQPVCLRPNGGSVLTPTGGGLWRESLGSGVRGARCSSRRPSPVPSGP